MKIAKALKLKNKLAGDITRLQQLISQENVLEEGLNNTRKFDVKKLYAELLDKQSNLVSLKANVARSNSVVHDLIFRLSELKSRVSFLRGLQNQVREGHVKETGYNVIVEREYSAVLTKEFLETEIKSVETEIEELQERLDQHNFTTEI